jgi:hypothetical protein
VVSPFVVAGLSVAFILGYMVSKADGVIYGWQWFNPYASDCNDFLPIE